MKSVRRALGIVLVLALMTALVAIGMWFTPTILTSLALSQAALAILGVAFIIAVIFQLGRALIAEIILREPPDLRAANTPLKLARDFNARTTGVLDVAGLASAMGAVIHDELKAPRSGWLLLTPVGTDFVVETVSGRGQLPPTPEHLPRNHVLLQMLTMLRAPLQHAALQADPQFAIIPPNEREWLQQLGAAVYAPLFEKGVLSAILVVGPRSDRRDFEPRELDLLMLLASQAEVTLKATRAIADLRKLNESMAALNESLRANNETLENMNKVRSDFLTIASHELRTPITQLLGFADLLGSMVRDNTLDAGVISDVTDSIVKACVRLGEVIAQMMEMSQIDVDKLDLRYEDTVVEDVLRLAVEPYLEASRERKQSLSVRGLRGLPAIRADKDRLVQAFNQLMSNAIKFTPDGGRIEIGARFLPADATEPARIEVVFIDTGIGIDPHNHNLIFQKFYRVGSSAQHSTSSTKFMGGGPGLGLAIVKGVIEAHGGKIWVESAGFDPVKFPGSRFHIVLPVTPPAFKEGAGAGQARKEASVVPSQKPFVGIE